MPTDVSPNKSAQDQAEVLASYKKKKKELVDAKDSELTRLNDKFKGEVEGVKEHQDAAINHIKARAVDREQRTEEKALNDNNYTKEASHKLRNKYQHDIHQEEITSENRLSSLKEEDGSKIKSEEDEQHFREDRLHQNFEKEMATINKEGNDRIHKRKDQVTEDLNKEDTYYKTETHKRREKQNEIVAKDNEVYQKTYQKNAEVYQKNLKQQRDKFDENYKMADKYQKDTFRDLDENLSAEITRLKIKNEEQEGLIKDQSKDSFYRVHDPRSIFTEHSSGYMLKAYIPESEKNNIKVKVNSDKITLSGSRQFQDAVKDDEKQIKTSNYQTFHEEFKLPYPADTKMILQERVGDYVEFKIPKLTLNKRA